MRDMTKEKYVRVNLRFGEDTKGKLETVSDMLGGFEGPGQVCRYLINRGLESMSVQVANYETQRQIRQMIEKQGMDAQELFDFMQQQASVKGGEK